jgi:hypothetical protein
LRPAQNFEVLKLTLAQERLHFVVAEFQKVVDQFPVTSQQRDVMCLLALAIDYFIGIGVSDELSVCKMSAGAAHPQGLEGLG